eukprot:scaffold1918_cov154-Amphora_coffeaeformis.AAC.10
MGDRGARLPVASHRALFESTEPQTLSYFGKLSSDEKSNASKGGELSRRSGFLGGQVWMVAKSPKAENSQSIWCKVYSLLTSARDRRNSGSKNGLRTRRGVRSPPSWLPYTTKFNAYSGKRRPFP